MANEDLDGNRCARSARDIARYRAWTVWGFRVFAPTHQAGRRVRLRTMETLPGNKGRKTDRKPNMNRP